MSYGLIAGAATCWGVIGMANRALSALGLDQGTIIVLRSGIAFAVLALVLLFTNRAAFRIRVRDMWCFIGTGIVSLATFNYCYLSAQHYMSLSAAAVLLYLAPVFVVLLSAPLFKERITPAKVIALALVLLGAVFTTGLLGSGEKLPLAGIALGVTAGLGYALYSIFSRFALQRGYSSSTITLYTFMFSALASLVLARPDAANITFSPALVFWALFMGLVCCLIPYALYTRGLEQVENGRASVVASLELVVATLVGVFAFGEAFDLANLFGIALVLGGIVVMNIDAFTHREGTQE